MRPVLSRRALAVVAIVLLAGLAACDFIPGAITSNYDRNQQSATEQYVNSALDYMQTYSVRKDSINWPNLRAEVLSRVSGTGGTESAYDALKYATTLLGDNHSRFLTPAEYSSGLLDPAPNLLNIPQARAVEDGIGYVFIPAFGGTNGRGRVDSTQRMIRTVDESMTLPPCGWIVDLRGNGGGNMYPMIAGVGPILGDGVAGYFVMATGQILDWYHYNGSAGSNGNVIVSTPTAYPLRKQNPPVAVLYNDRTASSGEATAISFRGRARTRSFGQPTRGLSTGNAAFVMSDGARLVLTTSRMADRNARIYGSFVVPDSTVPSNGTFTPGTLDATVEAARNWLRATPECMERALGTLRSAN